MNDTPQRCCRQCGVVVPETTEYFQWIKNGGPGGRGRWDCNCRTCRRANQNARNYLRGVRAAPYDVPLPPPTVRACKKCGEEKPITEEFFRKYAHLPNTLDGTCRNCRRAEGRVYNRESSRRRSQAAQAVAPFGQVLTSLLGEQEKACSQCGQVHPATSEFFPRTALRSGLGARCKACVALRRRKSYIDNREKELFNQRLYNARNGLRVRSAKRAAYRKMRLQSPERAVANWLNYRAKKRGAAGRVSGQELQELRSRQGGSCAYCGRPLYASGTPQVDHVIPLSRSELSPRGDIGNLVWSCGRCNRDKSAKTPEEWMSRWYQVAELAEIAEEVDYRVHAATANRPIRSVGCSCARWAYNARCWKRL